MIVKKIPQVGIHVDLTGPEGNSFYLLGLASKLSKKVGFNTEEVLKEMLSGDYENLVSVFDSYFGSVVILYR